MVDGRAVVVSILTRTRDRPLNVRRMPGPDTSNLPEAFVRLSGQLLGAPPAGHALEAMALGNSNAVDHLVLLKDGVDFNLFLEQTMTESNFVLDAAAIDLNFHQVGLFLLEGGLADLGVGKDADDGAVLLDTFQLASDWLGLLGVFLGVFCESLLLRLVPVLVKTSLDFVAKMFGPDCCEGSEATRGFDVANDANDDHLK